MRIAINGYGRIGRCVVRALYETGRSEQISIVGINDLSDIHSIAHLTQFDSTHGKFFKEVAHDGHHLLIGDDAIRVLNIADPRLLPWRELDVDVVLECTGSYNEREIAEQHLNSGAKRFIFSCPAQSDVDATIVYGLNHETLNGEHRIISNASCTTNCISHVIKILHQQFGIINGVITTVHSMMNDQPVIDAYHNPDLRKSRSSANSIIPVNTQLSRGIDRMFPELAGRFKAMALRVPVMNVSTMQLTASLQKKADASIINGLFKSAAENELQGILGYTELPLVSCDFNHNPNSAVFDGGHTMVSGENLASVMTWFDNEWGYANRMLDTAWQLFHA
ncbi:MAG: erythrose-4-phosphate dehydrogenase [Desulfobulbaceae bacterium]|nr:MAG: erythrose-4-phosphate dehydrogenase [Desulfobulbaceae bacterium]